MALTSDLDSTYVNRKGVSPNTLSVISQKVKMWAVPSRDGESAPKQVGVMSSFDPSESRSVEPIRGIGYGDQIAELIPGPTEPISLSVNRAAQYLQNIFQTFGYKGGVDGLVRSLKHHRWPFDIRQEVVFSEVVADNIDPSLTSTAGIQTPEDPRDAGFQAIVTVYEGCWFSDWGTSFAADTALVQENCSIMVSDVYDGQNITFQNAAEDTGNSSASARIQQVNDV
jgi:hypothetical protein